MAFLVLVQVKSRKSETLSYIISKSKHDQKQHSALSGVMASVVGGILNLALLFGWTVIFPNGATDYFALFLTIMSFAALYFLKIDVLLVVIIGGLCGLLKYLLI
ncbi:hypothetical protein BH10ACI1_BH10ACI1_04410 [soil metagenome]